MGGGARRGARTGCKRASKEAAAANDGLTKSALAGVSAIECAWRCLAEGWGGTLSAVLVLAGLLVSTGRRGRFLDQAHGVLELGFVRVERG